MATNRIDILDQALLRPGRIDRKIEFPNPNEESRWDILKIHSRRMNLMRGIDLKKIAEKMNGASGAELKVLLKLFLLGEFIRKSGFSLEILSLYALFVFHVPAGCLHRSRNVCTEGEESACNPRRL